MVQSTREASSPLTAHERLELALYTVETASYASLQLVNRSYPYWILSHVLHGEVETCTGNEKWRVRAGDIMLHPPHLPFSEQASSVGVHQWLLFDVMVSPNIDLFRLHPVAPVLSLFAPEHFAQTFEMLQRAWNDAASLARRLQTFGLTMQLFGIVLESWQRAGSVPRSPALRTPQDRFIEAIAYMTEHLDQKLSRDDLAAMVHLNPGYFDRVFRSTYGLTPMQMLRDLRLQHALQLLESTDAPLAAIAMACGLSDAAYLSRVFRQRYGQTPGQYREGAKSTRTGYIPPL